MANNNERQKLISTILNKIVDDDEREIEAAFLNQLSIGELRGLAEDSIDANDVIIYDEL